jgi:hypothetical protein
LVVTVTLLLCERPFGRLHIVGYSLHFEVGEIADPIDVKVCVE